MGIGSGGLSKVLRSTAAMCRLLKKEDGKHLSFFGCFSYPFRQGRLCRLLLGLAMCIVTGTGG